MKAMSSLALLMLCLPILAHAVWTAPDNPDPQEVMNSVSADIGPLRYSILPSFGAADDDSVKADLLARLVWFEQNALRLQPSQLVVRDSFAVDDWHYLATVYPPALVELNAARDRAEARVRDGTEALDSFAELTAIDRQFDAESKTAELFTWLDVNRPELARKTYEIAQPALIATKQYALCGKFLDSEKMLRSQISSYRWFRDSGNKPVAWSVSGFFLNHINLQAGENIYKNASTNLVALLVLNDRKDEAIQIAAHAEKELDDADYRAAMERALTGELPPTWPPKPGASVLEKLAGLFQGAFKLPSKQGI